jgi:2-methylcitrate dehydratase PrpD
VSPPEVDTEALGDAATQALADRVTLVEESSLNGEFPQATCAWVEIRLEGGRVCLSDVHRARGEPGHPLSRDEIHAKFRSLTEPVIGSVRAARLLDLTAGAHALRSLDAMWAVLRDTGVA